MNQQSEIWAKHQRELAEIQINVPDMKNLEPDRILHFASISDFVKQENDSYLSISSPKRLIYWMKENNLEKCVYDKKTEEFSVKKMSYPEPLQRLEDYLYGTWFSGMFTSITYILGSVAEKQGYIEWDLNNPSPWIIMGGIGLLAFSTTLKFRDEEKQHSKDKKIQELLIDREAWKKYRKSPYGRKF